MIAELQGVSKSYGSVHALRQVSLAVSPGEFVAVLGPNGAGKTTAMRLLVGTRRPDAGKAALFGQDPTRPANRLRIGVTPQESRFPPTLRTREVIQLVAAHYPEPLTDSAVISEFGLQDTYERQIGGLSGGQQRRLAVAMAFVGRPELVFLDEPTTGLDVSSRQGLWQHVRQYRETGGALLLTTHYLEEAEALADRIIVINKGTIQFEGTVEEIRSRLGLTRVSLSTTEPDRLPIPEKTVDGDRVTLYVRDADELIRTIVRDNVAFNNLEVRPVSLEEAFLALTSK